MEVLVCCKIEPDLERLTEGDWQVRDPGGIDTSYVSLKFSPCDESALETALGLADAGPVRLTALTLDGRRADPFLRTLLALRFEAVRIEPGEDLRFRPGRTAALITAYLRGIRPQDVLLFGRQSSEGGHGQTPLLVAEMLHWPCVTEVVRIEALEAGRIRVCSRVEGGLRTQVLRPPCVLAVGDIAHSTLRVPTLSARMQHGKRPIQVFDGPALGAEPCQDAVLLGLTPVSHRRAGVRLDGRDPRAAARTLFFGYLQDRLGSR